MKCSIILYLLSSILCGAAPKLQSPRGAEQFAAPAARRLYIRWQYDQPMPAPDIEFDIFHQVDATVTWPSDPRTPASPVVNLSTNWEPFATAAAPPVIFIPTRECEFFKIRTRRISTGETSAWCSK